MRWCTVVLLVAVAGCGKEDLATSVLPSGTEAVVFRESKPGDDSDSVPIRVPEGKGVLGTLGMIKLGTKVVVIEDVRSEDPKAEGVRVNVKEGEYAGIVGKMSRSFL